MLLTLVIPQTTVGQQPAPATTGGWSPFTSDRPKSAVAAPSTSSGMMQGGAPGGIVSALTGGSRPSTSTQQQVGMAPGASSAQAAQWNGNGASNAALPANANTLSYGSLKNRFLSGASKNNGTTNPPQASAGPVASSNNPSAQTSGKSKLFSLAR